MRKPKKVDIFAVACLIALLIFWTVSEVRWARINSPKGRFTNVAEYVAYGRGPSRVTKVTNGDGTFFIAYGPYDSWLALPSGPAGYVFDESGNMVGWSGDTGDDSSFQKQWPLPQEESSLAQLKQLATH